MFQSETQLNVHWSVTARVYCNKIYAFYEMLCTRTITTIRCQTFMLKM